MSDWRTAEMLRKEAGELDHWAAVKEWEAESYRKNARELREQADEKDREQS